ncbi:MAG: D-allose ABC transporter permease [Synergistaceae bacterium]|jgi:D-allose transport system permease protein|nr:D-allose ABC transporter permease [Synergistaceae bacterium]
MEKKTFAYYWERFGTLSIFTLMILITSFFAPPQFLSTTNLVQIVTQSATTMLLASGEFFAILIAGIDLSVGSVLALSGMATAKIMAVGLHPIFAVLAGSIGVGALLGAVNGALVNFTRLHPFIITLGTQSIYRGLTLILSNAKPVFGFPQSFKTALGGMLFGRIPMPVATALTVAAVLWFLTSRTVMGRNLYAIGGNRNSAWYSGIDVKLHTLLVFVISGICAGLAGAVMMARLGSAESMAGVGHDTFAIAAAIIGGASFFGGKGKIPNVIVGALIIGLINNALNMLSIETYYQQVATGSLIIGAVALDMVASHRK